MAKKKDPSSSNPEPVTPTTPVEPVTTPPTSGNNPAVPSATQTAQKEKLYDVRHLLKKNSMQLTEAPWCIGKTAMSQEEFDKGKDAWFKKEEKKETSPDDGNTEVN